MKRYMFFLLLFLHLIGLKGQIKGNKGVSILAGYEKNGTTYKASYNQFVQNGFLSVGVQVNNESFYNKGYVVKVVDFIGDIQYHRLLVSSFNNFIRVYVGAGIKGGYNQVNNNKETLEDGAIIREKTSFIYGAEGNIQADVFLFTFKGNPLALLLNASQEYYLKREQGNYLYNFGAGIRFIF